MDISQFLGGSFMTHLNLPLPVQTWTLNGAAQKIVDGSPSICVTFAEFPNKELKLNQTNMRRLAILCSNDTKLWTGKSTLVYRTDTTYQGKKLPCLRLNSPDVFPPIDEEGNPEQILNLDGTPYVGQPAIPGEAPRSGSCGGIQLLRLEYTQVRRKW